MSVLSQMASRHASIRSTQRGIPAGIVEWLLEYGQVEYQHDGTELYFFSKASKRCLERDKGTGVVKCVERFRRAYLGKSITTGQIVTT